MENKPAKIVIGAVIYLLFAAYLCRPCLHGSDSIKPQALFVISTSLGAVGCFLLSRRWVLSFWASLFAGALYGFGPFMLSLSKYHPAAVLSAAAVPWLFCPAVFITRKGYRWAAIPLTFAGFALIAGFFQLCEFYKLFPVPIRIELRLRDLMGIVAPLVNAGEGAIDIGIYRVTLAPLLMGLMLMIKARRWFIIAVIAAGIVLASIGPVLDVSPIAWLSIPIAGSSVIVAIGIQAIMYAGYDDRKWLIAALMLMGGLCIATLLCSVEFFQAFAGLANRQGNLLLQTARIYLLGALAIAVIFFIARARLRATIFRWALLYAAIAVDVVLGGRFIMNKVF